ncbi:MULTISPECIES: manganese efflux pump MntP [Methanothermobacter]|uniref:Putative manganese efflux pump MntP n=1 Tax=Methanothermobacter wolfeii TaxID=145261 RepID=A0A9E7RVB8_METWO|nr:MULTISPECIES: manganese efflux pump MntP family protein [Methanothermobacter]NLM03083.1 manganese efflux pump [Methanothermobacter wolfeii]QHN05896.1 manganese efflux pump [Methanothermobacter sp. THM-1]UXH32057.1 manganese efflux pump MntP family protein [Methanothermobacter wolfeii]
MDILSMVFLGIGLGMDVFSVSVSRGVITHESGVNYTLISALSFGIFQAGMPVLGWLSGLEIQAIVSAFAPWIAFLLLLIIGLKMIYESFMLEEDEFEFNYRELFILSIATSIDAFAVGVSFALLDLSIWLPVLIIGVLSFIMSIGGSYLGERIGHIFENRTEALGGVILIIIGLKILLENTAL